MTSQRIILHVDADAFFVSVEQALHPELAGLAVIVGGSNRGVVSSASYEARRLGVHSAMPIAHARRLCPHAVFLKPNFEAYSHFSRQMFDIMRAYSPEVEATSIDEGYVDLTGTLRLHKAPPWEIAHRLLNGIRTILSINASGGIAGSKSEAKMATGLAKPNGLIYLDPANSHIILGGLSASAVPGVGKRASEILNRHGIKTVRDIAGAGPKLVRSLLGEWGERIVEIASGNDSRPVCSGPSDPRRSYSRDRTLASDTRDRRFVRDMAWELGENLAAKLRRDGRAASTLTVRIRYHDFSQVSKSATLRHASQDTTEILDVVDRLLTKALIKKDSVRQVGVKLSGITSPCHQEDLFDPLRPMRLRRDRAVDTIRDRFGFHAIRPARTMGRGSETVSKLGGA